MTANGFAITEDGTVWINKSFVDSGKVIDFNKVTQHEISHIIFGKDSEFQAQYLESAYGSFLEGISENGYLHDNAGITDYDTSSLSMFDRMLLNSYILDQIQLWEPTGDDRIDRVVRVTHLMPEVQQKRNISIIGRLEKIYKPGNKERERRRKDIETRVRKKKIAENNKKKPSDKKNSKELEKEIAKEVNTKLKTSDITNIEGQDVKMLFKEIEADRKMGITQKENIMFKETVKKHPEMIDAYFRKSRKDRIDEIRMLDFYKQKIDKLGLTSKQIADFAYIANEGIYDELWSKSPGENYKTPYSNVKYKVLDKIDMLSGLQAVLIQDPNKKGNAMIVFQGSNPGITDRKRDPINWDKDWSNNSENISSLTSVLSVPSTIFGNTFNIIGQGIKNAGNAISSSSVVKISELCGIIPREWNNEISEKSLTRTNTVLTVIDEECGNQIVEGKVERLKMYGKKLEEYFSKPRNFEEIDWYEFMKFNNIHPIITIYVGYFSKEKIEKIRDEIKPYYNQKDFTILFCYWVDNGNGYDEKYVW